MANKTKKVSIGFKALSDKIQKGGKSKASADAIAASVGRKKFGAANFQKMATKGKKGKK